jgi:hypothetical protein
MRALAPEVRSFNSGRSVAWKLQQKAYVGTDLILENVTGFTEHASPVEDRVSPVGR